MSDVSIPADPPRAPSPAFRDEQGQVPSWASDNDDDLLKFLFVSPRPCRELDRLFASR